MAKSIERHHTAQKLVQGRNTQAHLPYLLMFILFACSILIYTNTLGHGFVLDDPLAIELNKHVTSGFSGIIDIIKGGYRENNFGGQLYRPVSLIQFAIEWQLSPNNPFIHHGFNVLWYAVSVVMVFLVISQWFSKQNILFPLIVALLFAVHPVHTEVVANIKSRDEIMSMFFVLSAFWAYGNFHIKEKVFWLYGAMILYFFALTSKESAVTMFPVFGMLSWWTYQKDIKNSIKTGIWFLVPVIILMLIRFSIFDGAPTPTTDIMDNPIVAASGFGQKTATSMVILIKYLTILIFPHPLSSDYSYSVIPLVGLTDLKTILSVFIHTTLLAVALVNIKNRHFLGLLILGYLMSIFLFSQIPMVIGTMFGERLAYLPSFWFISGLVFLILKLLKTDLTLPINSLHQAFKNIPVILSAVFILTVACGYKTVERNKDWKDNYSLFIKDAATYPQSVRLNNGAAEQSLRLSNKEGLNENEVNRLLTEAEKYCQQIMTIKPVATAYLTLGNIRLKQKKYTEAIAYYDQVNDLKSIVDKNKALAYREMGREAGEKEQNLQKSQELLSQSISLNGEDAETWFLMGVSYGIAGNHLKAAENFEKAYALKPDIQYAKNVIMAYQNLGNQTKVEEYKKYITK